MFGKQNVGREWRQDFAIASACLRSLRGYAHRYLTDAELSPAPGGPPV